MITTTITCDYCNRDLSFAGPHVELLRGAKNLRWVRRGWRGNEYPTDHADFCDSDCLVRWLLSPEVANRLTGQTPITD
jgi:hypothetical protein